MRPIGRACSGILVATALVAGVASSTELDIQGHRGCRGLRPENTLPAFEHAIELGIKTLEMDLQVTRDRVVIVTHDQQLDASHCRNDDGSPLQKVAFKDLEFADLAQVDCGYKAASGFPEQQPVEGARIPSLEQVLELAKAASYPVWVSVEIKLQSEKHGIPVEEFAKLTVDLLRKHGMESRAIVQSFDPEALRVMYEMAPEIPRAVLVRKPGRYDAVVEEAQATILSPKHGALRQDAVKRFQERGIQVIPWTVNDPGDIRRVLGFGVDGVITDYPDRVLEIHGTD